MIFLLPAHGLNLIVGYTGMLSLAQGAFFGIGAYTAGAAVDALRDALLWSTWSLPG